MKTPNEVLKELYAKIDTELAFCNPIDTPYVCRMHSAKSRLPLREVIARRVIQYGMEIGETILALEREYNPNIPD